MSVTLIRNIPTRNTSDQAWIQWYDALRKEFGRKKANQLFIANWDAQAGNSSQANTSTLRKHMQKFGIDVDGGVIGGLQDFGLSAYNYFGDIFTVSKFIGLGLAIVVAGSFAYLVIQVAVKPSVRQEAIRVGSAVATRGATEIGTKK